MVQVDPVGDQDDARVVDVGVQRQGFGQHDHGERFAGAGGMPDDAAGALALGVEGRNPFEGGFDGEILLVAGDLFVAAIKDDELVAEFQQAFGREQTHDGTVLFGWQALRLAVKPLPTTPGTRAS